MPFRVNPPIIHQHFRSKSVCQLICQCCTNTVCNRGMKAMLLADTRVELYSTDLPPTNVQLVDEDYVTKNCQCRIRNVACLGCGNVVGYHITQPCSKCMESCNNGHFWMFHTSDVFAQERLDSTGTRILLWAFLQMAENELDSRGTEVEQVCR